MKPMFIKEKVIVHSGKGHTRTVFLYVGIIFKIITLNIKPINCNKMKEITYAQDVIRKRIDEKKSWQETFQDYSEHTDYEAYTDYNDCHGDYYDYEVAN